MKIYKFPNDAEVRELITRPTKDAADLSALVSQVLARIQREGDAAVLDYERQFDHVELTSLAVTEAEFQAAEAQVGPELKSALELAHANIARFHEAQRYAGIELETAPGVRCWQRSVPIEKVGLYIPGGTAPLFSTVLMLATPARIAGCREIVLCTPPRPDGTVNPAILVAARIAGVSRVFKAGGVQAIGAMAYGTESVPKVYKIFGPGNQFVQCAKQLVSLADVAIDLPAGPSEVEVIADATANPVFVAADLLSQAEHGRDSQVMLVSTDEAVAKAVAAEVDRQVKALGRADLAMGALAKSHAVVLKSTDDVVAFADAYAPEHLIIATCDPWAVADRVTAAGSVFVGAYTPESAGDYASGTNHTLPTSGWARSHSGVNIDSYMRKMTLQEISRDGLRSLAPTIVAMAEAEGLQAHAAAASIRIKR